MNVLERKDNLVDNKIIFMVFSYAMNNKLMLDLSHNQCWMPMRTAVILQNVPKWTVNALQRKCWLKITAGFIYSHFDNLFIESLDFDILLNVLNTESNLDLRNMLAVFNRIPNLLVFVLCIININASGAVLPFLKMILLEEKSTEV